MQAIKKLKDNKIFKEDTIVESVVQKVCGGLRFQKSVFLELKKLMTNTVFVKK